MSDETFHQPHLPGSRGSSNYASWSATHYWGEGWSVRFWHRHDGEKDLCVEAGEVRPARNIRELLEIIEAQVLSLNDTHTNQGASDR